MDQLTASGEACEMIIVSPNAGGNPATCWNGYFNMPGWAYEDFFYKEFLPYIEKTYRVKGDKRHRAIAGLSMGGGGTASYAQRYPDMYCAAYAMSALMNIFQAMRNAGIPCQFRVRDGGHTSEYWHSALYMCLPFVSRSFAK